MKGKRVLRKGGNPKNTKLLQIYMDPDIYRTLGHYCLDNDKKNAPVVRKLLPRFLKEQGYYNKRGKE